MKLTSSDIIYLQTMCLTDLITKLKLDTSSFYDYLRYLSWTGYKSPWVTRIVALLGSVALTEMSIISPNDGPILWRIGKTPKTRWTLIGTSRWGYCRQNLCKRSAKSHEQQKNDPVAEKRFVS